jgi:hypothetical protein
LGIFTHRTDFRDIKDVERVQIHDEVVSRLVVERGHRRFELLRTDAERRFRCCVVVLAKGHAVGSPQRVFGVATSGDVSLPEHEMDRADGQEQKKVKHASNETPFNDEVDALFHFACAMVGASRFYSKRVKEVEAFRSRNFTNLRNRRRVRAFRSRCQPHRKREPRHHVTGCKISRSRLQLQIRSTARRAKTA